MKNAYILHEDRMKMGLLGRNNMEHVFGKELVVENAIPKLL